MKISLSKTFLELLSDQIIYIAKDKPNAAKKFKKDLISSLKKDLLHPYNFRKSIHFNDTTVRDYTFKGYFAIYKIESNSLI
jgi:plasmid stabilization system protein ParE